MSSIPHKEIHAAATNPSERGFPTRGKPTPDDQDAWSAPNNPATKTPAEQNKQWEGKTLDGRGAGTSGGRGKEILANEESGGGTVGHGDSGGTANLNKHQSKEEWKEQEGKIGQGSVAAPAATGPKS
jgi:hypothetical protein